MSDCDSLVDSEPGDSLVDSELGYNPCSALNEMCTSSGSDIDSENEGGRRKQLTTDEIIAEAFSKKKQLNSSATNAHLPAEKHLCKQAPPNRTRANKHTRVDDVRHFSSCHRPSVVPPPPSVTVDDEVKCAFKEITQL